MGFLGSPNELYFSMPLSLANGKWYLIQEVKVLIHRQWGGTLRWNRWFLNVGIYTFQSLEQQTKSWLFGFFRGFYYPGEKKNKSANRESLFSWLRGTDHARLTLSASCLGSWNQTTWSFRLWTSFQLSSLSSSPLGFWRADWGWSTERNMGDGLGHVSSYSRLPAGTWTINRMVDVPAIRESFVWLGVGVLVLVDPFCEKRESQNILHPFIIIYSWLTHVQDFFIPCCVQQYGARISNKQVWRYLCVTKLCIFEDRLIRIDLCLC